MAAMSMQRALLDGLLLAFLASALLLTRTVGLHWHTDIAASDQDTQTALTTSYLADASTPHPGEVPEHESPVTGADGRPCSECAAQSLTRALAMAPLLFAWTLAQMPDLRRIHSWPRPAHSTLPWRASVLPPLRAPPL